jgi:hypothetical protein
MEHDGKEGWVRGMISVQAEIYFFNHGGRWVNTASHIYLCPEIEAL